MELKLSDNNLKIIYNDREVFKAETGNYLCSLGNGKNDFSMSHGTFKIKEKIDFKKDYYVKSIELKGNSAVIHSTALDIVVTAENECRLKFEPVLRENFNRMWIKIPSKSDEKVYGCGEQFTEFNLRGKKVNVWVAEHINAFQIAKKIFKMIFGVKNTTKKQPFKNYETYYAEPTFLSSEKYYFHSSAVARSEFDFSDENYHYIKVDGIAPFYIGFGESFEDVMFDMTLLLGRQPQLPDWVYDGSILGIQGGTDIMMSKVQKCLDANTDVCGVWIQDWEGRRVTAVGKQLQWNWQCDEVLYPNLKEKIKELNEKGIKVLGYINPFLAVEKPLYKEAREKGYCVKDKNGEDYYVKITTFPAAMIDLTNNDACEWIKGIIKSNMIDLGFSGWMADFGEYLPTDCVLSSRENPQLVHNTWPARWARVNREAVEESGKLGEIMFFTRAGFTDTKKYSTMMWNGDNHTDYSVDFGIPSVIPAALSLTCCGFGLSHSDVGGYTSIFNLKRSEELFMRWCEMNAFSPLMRGHEGINPDVNAQFDASEEVLLHHAKMSRIHKALKPYIKLCAEKNAESGLGIIRPLFFHYDEDEAYNQAYEYLLGRDILVAPVIKENASSRDVYLPNDTWVHLWNEKEYSGGNITVKSPIGEPPVFIRKNSNVFSSLMAVKNQ